MSAIVHRTTGSRWWKWLLGPQQGQCQDLECLAFGGLHHSSDCSLCLELLQTTQDIFGCLVSPAPALKQC